MDKKEMELLAETWAKNNKGNKGKKETFIAALKIAKQYYDNKYKYYYRGDTQCGMGLSGGE